MKSISKTITPKHRPSKEAWLGDIASGKSVATPVDPSEEVIIKHYLSYDEPQSLDYVYNMELDIHSKRFDGKPHFI